MVKLGTKPGSPRVTKRTYDRLMRDMREYGRAFVRHDWPYAHRIHPSTVTVLQGIQSDDAIAAARSDGVLVDIPDIASPPGHPRTGPTRRGA